MDAQLVLKAGGAQIVARTGLTIGVEQEFGHNEQADPARASGRTGGAGQHQMDDVIGQLVVAPGDVDLAALDQVLAHVGPALDPGGHGTQRADV